MVQGLGFLSKKSWHTKNKANQEKVWIEEQKQAAEASKTKELARQIQQEREQEEMDRITGKKTVMDRGINWMYEGGTTGELAKEDAEKKAEEYLLGKEFVGDGAARGDFDAGNQQEGINKVAATAAATGGVVSGTGESQMTAAAGMTRPAAASAYAAEPSVHDRNENFRLRNEDPMYFVSQKEREKQKKHDTVKELYSRVVGRGGNNSSDEEERSHSRDRKRSKKERKRDKKKKKRKKKSSSRRDDYDSDDDDDDDDSRRRKRRRRRSPSRSRSRSNSHDRHHRKGARRSSRDERGYDSQSDDDSYDRHGYKQQKHRRHYEEDDDRKMPARTTTSSRRHDRDHDRDDRRKVRRHHDEYDDRKQRERDDHKPRQTEREEVKKQEGYGLKGASAPLKVSDRDLGPCEELLRRKREERDRERRRNTEISRSRKRMTEEDRKKALEEMQQDAKKREQRMERQTAGHRKDHTTTEEEEEEKSRGNASFLNDIAKHTHGIHGNESMSSRVAQNRHTNQRLHDSFF
mmetsp:Transcript_27822/g.52180  ORF Transcript_27822/g.52180 Transcript_27822/m.52180 type:complete len:519 (+) Transcript_27822:55-1611(+)